MTTACLPSAARTEWYRSSSVAQLVATSMVSTNAPVRNTGEVESLAAFLLRMREEPAERARRSEAARRWYLENATLDAMASNYLAFSRELAGRPPEG